ncbi:GNAT family N-acetyltransferase [Nocardioides humilatus]|uniref:GNAT family N-acetyltransferase n=1 Tax=Nocardioides humilatus TaxID=2607660 RepID=A0A5B1LN82_9ACTN|nr:GNAT family protein [Nocardioides humilatus]KAA1421568.1 GNAT family N-acetyltransferase [Nocardioides humilatus]
MLPLWDATVVQALRTGERLEGWHPSFPRDDDVDATGVWRENDPWGPRSILVDGLVCGSIGFFGPPEPAADGVPEVEIGYGLVEEVRGRGVGTRAVLWALTHCDREGVRVRASIAPDNAASLALAAKAGFTTVRGTNDQGELVLVRPVAQVQR